MRAVLILRDERAGDARVLVFLKERRLRAKVIELLEHDRGKEAFEIFKTKAEVQAYLPAGAETHMSEMTLVEELL
ncbi:MAG: hypothetical protein HQL19_03045 [Candidatus Omnitrophica bacterium]|nr:hypothetical protein [Candidatus Omnitrophota bacterium]